MHFDGCMLTGVLLSSVFIIMDDWHTEYSSMILSCHLAIKMSIMVRVLWCKTYFKMFVCLQGVYCTFVYDSSPASQAGLQIHDKILQVGYVCQY